MIDTRFLGLATVLGREGDQFTMVKRVGSQSFFVRIETITRHLRSVMFML